MKGVPRIRKFGCGPVLLVSHLPGLRTLFAGRRPGAASRTLFARTSGRAIGLAASRPLAAAVIDSQFTDGRMDGLELALNLKDLTAGLRVWVISRRADGTPSAIPVSTHGREPRRPVTIPAMFGKLRRTFRGGGR